MDKNQAIVIIGGGLVKDKEGFWRTTTFKEGDDFGALGDNLRVVAGSILAKKYPDALVIALGGKGQLEKIKDAPTVASIIKKELVSLGIDPLKIICEEKSGSTFQQLRELKKIIEDKRIESLLIISNKYHLPRVEAMLASVK